MPTTGLRTHKLAIERLKGIRGLDEISFEDKPLTGIFGPNGIGKSTVLQALASAYGAPAGCVALDYKRFFPPLAADIWNGTSAVYRKQLELFSLCFAHSRTRAAGLDVLQCLPAATQLFHD